MVKTVAWRKRPPNTPLSHHILILSAHHWIQAHAASRRIQGILQILGNHLHALARHWEANVQGPRLCTYASNIKPQVPACKNTATLIPHSWMHTDSGMWYDTAALHTREANHEAIITLKTEKQKINLLRKATLRSTSWNEDRWGEREWQEQWPKHEALELRVKQILQLH